LVGTQRQNQLWHCFYNFLQNKQKYFRNQYIFARQAQLFVTKK
jgi:hypothetical protein